MNNYRPAGISTATIPVIPVSNSVIDVRAESPEVDERETHITEDRAIDQAYEDYEFEWSSEKSIIQVAEEVGATDEVIVRWIFNIAQSWTKNISTKEWIENVADDTVQLTAWKLLSQMKGHFDQKKKKDSRNKNIRYILIPDGK